MANRYGIETQPYQLSVNQIEVPAGQKSNLTKKAATDLANRLKDNTTNLVLPIACMTDTENKYHLLTGFDIYEATKTAGLKDIWVFIIAAPQKEATQWVETHGLLSKLNESLIEPQDVDNFIKFINDEKSDITIVSGIGAIMADKIRAKRPYKNLEDIQENFGKKRPLNWIRAYKS